jgi:hypothetical protein
MSRPAAIETVEPTTRYGAALALAVAAWVMVERRDLVR